MRVPLSVTVLATVLLPCAVHAVPSRTYISLPPVVTPRLLDRSLVGFSFEVLNMQVLAASPIGANVMSALGARAGQPPAIRIGGSSNDKTFYDAKATSMIKSYPKNITIGPTFFNGFSNYLPQATEIVFTLNLAIATLNQTIALAQAAIQGLGQQLRLFEIGNEVDHYPTRGLRPANWSVVEYASEWQAMVNNLLDYSNQTGLQIPGFQSGVFADTPNAITNNFSIPNLVMQGNISSASYIKTYAMHLYPQSRCTAARTALSSIATLSDHYLVLYNLTMYSDQIAAANSVGADFVLGETNSASCSGIYGLSDTFASALWAVDWMLTGATLGIKGFYFHGGPQAAYSPFQSTQAAVANQILQPGVLPLSYGALFVASIINSSQPLYIARLPFAQQPDFSGFGVYVSANDTSATSLKKLVFINMALYNSSVGVSHPSSPTYSDSPYYFNTTKKVTSVTVKTPYRRGTVLDVIRLSAPGSNAKSNVTVQGMYFDNASGNLLGMQAQESVIVSWAGKVAFKIAQAEAIILQSRT